MALQPWTAPPGGDADGDAPGALALVTTASGERVTVAEYERRVKEADALGEKLKVITESIPTITRNVQGSAAGAGSSTFHIYRLARSRNAAREAAMDAAEAAADAQAGVEARRTAAAAADEARTAKKRAERAKKKARKGQKRARTEDGGGDGGGGGEAPGGGGGRSPGAGGGAAGVAPAADLD